VRLQLFKAGPKQENARGSCGPLQCISGSVSDEFPHCLRAYRGLAAPWSVAGSPMPPRTNSIHLRQQSPRRKRFKDDFRGAGERRRTRLVNQKRSRWMNQRPAQLVLEFLPSLALRLNWLTHSLAAADTVRTSELPGPFGPTAVRLKRKNPLADETRLDRPSCPQ
jgi:hypothetical protein